MESVLEKWAKIEWSQLLQERELDWFRDWFCRGRDENGVALPSAEERAEM